MKLLNLRHCPFSTVHRVIAGAALCLLATALHGQSSTSSAISGFIFDDRSQPLAEARVEILHEPTGSLQILTTRSNGRFQATGLRPGGPYTISVQAPGHQPQQRRDISVGLGSEQRVDFFLPTVADDTVFILEDFEVIADDGQMAFAELSKGPRTVLDETDLRLLPTVSRSLTDFTRLDPRMAVLDRASGSISAGGANTRYNTLLIDGVPANDTFGLNPNGLPSFKQPFSLDSIAAVSVEISPYSVEQAGFTGASIRTVTKSGTNEFRGSVFGYFNNSDLTGDLYDLDGTLVPYKDYREYTAGLSLGGPIIRDRLFFFVNVERVEESVVQDVGGYVPTEAALQRIVDFSRQVYGFDPGTLTLIDRATFTDDKLLIKLDWNITDRHRATVRYNHTESKEPRFPGLGGSGGISLSSRWYDQVLSNRDYTAEVFSQWTPDFSTEVLVSFRQYESSRNENSDLPSISISGVEGFATRPNADGSFSPRTGTVTFGRLNSGHANLLKVDTTIVRLKGVYRFNAHTLTAGLQLERFDNYNLFITDALGTWQYLDGLPMYAPVLENQFDTIAAREGGRASSYRYSAPAEGNSGAAEWAMTTVSAYIQDEWQVNPRLSLITGVRMDYPIVNQSPPEAAAAPDNRSFKEVFGYDNTVTVDGNGVLQPRVGFTYKLSEDTINTLRGGIGLFYGRAPHVWLSTTYVENGRTIESYFASRSATPPFAIDPPVLPEPETIRNRVNLLDPDFQMPTEWKANLAWDRKLPVLDFVLTLEAQWSRTKTNIHYEHLNLRQRIGNNFTGFLPDGRELYDSNFARERELGYGDVFLLTNTDKGDSANYTIELKRPMLNNWSARVGYTYSEANSVNDGLANSAFDNWQFNTATNPNDAQLGTSRFETRHRLVASASYMVNWSRRHRTTFTLVYDGRSGRPFSYVFGGPFTGNAADINKDRIIGTNDLLYVPSGIDDPLVEWGPNNRDRDTRGVAFMEFVEATAGLREYKGQVVPRNTGRAPFFHQFDLNITHTIRTWETHSLELICSVQNIGNLLNKEWGRERRPQGANNTIGIMRPLYIPIARGDKGNENGYYRYEFDATSLSEQNTYQIRDAGSRWSVLLGLRYNF